MSVRKYTLGEMVNLVVRRRWLILVPFAIGVALTPLLARYAAPARYRSEALILVVPQQVPDSYVMPTVRQSLEERLSSITDQILSRNKLETIILEMNLYKAERARNVMEDVVGQMRGDIKTSAVGRNVDSFRITYASENADTAQKVTERLSSLYIDQNAIDRADQAELTSQFLATQLADTKRRLIEQEKKLEAYSKQYAGQLPSQQQANLQAIQSANIQLQSVSESSGRIQQSRQLIERQIADALSIPDVASSAPPSSSLDVSAPVTTAQLLVAARARRAALVQRFTAEYPEVVSLDRTIVELEAKFVLERPVGGTAVTAETPLSPAEAAQQKKIRELQADLAVLDRQLEVNRGEAERHKATAAQYQAKLDALPTRQSEMVELTRDYSTTQELYANLLMKSEESAIAANLERKKIGEMFKLVDEASRPERPYNQRQRQTIMASGAAGGLAIGLLLVGFLELRNSSFKHADEVLKAISVPVLASIPVMRSERERTTALRRRQLMDVAGLVLLFAAGAVLALWRLRLLG